MIAIAAFAAFVSRHERHGKTASQRRDVDDEPFSSRFASCAMRAALTAFCPEKQEFENSVAIFFFGKVFKPAQKCPLPGIID